MSVSAYEIAVVFGFVYSAVLGLCLAGYIASKVADKIFKQKGIEK